MAKHGYKTEKQIYEFMISYQQRYGVPPKLKDIVPTSEKTNYRSSIHHCLHRLIQQGKVVEIKPPGYARRYQAI